jgi:hypothetical protein
MELLQDGLIAFFSAVGVTACVWMIAGAFLGEKCRNPEILLILPARGEAPAMASDLRELLRLRRNLPEATIVIEDRGLQPASRELANYFCQRYSRVELRQAEKTVE